MYYDFAIATRDWNTEVDAEAARLVEEQGIPPYRAIGQAQRTVEKRRAEKARAQKEGDLNGFKRLISR